MLKKVVIAVAAVATITHPLVGYETETVVWARLLRAGSFHLLRLHLDLRSGVLQRVTVTFPLEKCSCTFQQSSLGGLFM